jgi:hypothetical protein
MFCLITDAIHTEAHYQCLNYFLQKEDFQWSDIQTTELKRVELTRGRRGENGGQADTRKTMRKKHMKLRQYERRATFYLGMG